MIRILVCILLVLSCASSPAQSTKPRKDCVYKAIKVNGALARDSRQISCVLDQHKGGIYALYVRSLRNNPTLSGEVKISFQIDAAGRVQNAWIERSTLSDAQLKDGLLEKLRSMQWPSMPGVSWSGSHPFTFLSTDQKR